MKYLKKITNGIILIVLGVMHTNFGLSVNAFGNQFKEFSKTNFFEISKGVDELPAEVGRTNFESLAAFWFFYFGILVISLGVLTHSIERRIKILPIGFILSYLLVIMIGAYMIPKSGMTIYMLPHALFMLIQNIVRRKKLNLQSSMN